MLALLPASVLAGCFGSHDRPPDPPGAQPDAGTIPGPTCEEDLPASFMSLLCPVTESPSAGDWVSVEVEYGAGRCCGSGSGRAGAAPVGPGRFDVTGSVTACDCAAGRCIGPVHSEWVPIGPLVAGVNTVTAGSFSCTIATAPPRECSPAALTETYVADVLFPGQDLTMTLVQREGWGCGCSPSVATLGSNHYGLQLCDCCRECDCIDGGYEASLVTRSPGYGFHTLQVGDELHDLGVFSPDECPGTPAPISLQVVGPAPERASGGPRIHWAVIGYEYSSCCGGPMVGVLEHRDRDGSLDLELRQCTVVDCLCDPPLVPTVWTVWHALGTLPAGTHRLRAGAHQVVVSVP